MKRAERLARIARRHGFRCAIGSVKEHALYRFGGVYMRRYDPAMFTTADAEPDRVIEVPAREIKYFQPSIFSRFVDGFERADWPNPVVGGHWDRLRLHFGDRLIHQGFVAHFHQDIPWEETVFIQQCIDDIESGRTAFQDCQTVDELMHHCEEVDALYTKMAEEGYRSARELGEPESGEITVNIDRHGNLMQTIDGKHRMLIAKLLDLDRVAVQVYARHSEWERRRRKASAQATTDHPDLQ